MDDSRTSMIPIETNDLEECWSPEEDKSDYQDVPDFVTDIKQEILSMDEEVPKFVEVVKIEKEYLLNESIKIEEDSGDKLEVPNLIKFEEVDVKSEGEGKRVSSDKYGEDKETEMPKRHLKHKCTECYYQTNRKHNLATHMLRHKSFKGSDMLKCSECGYQTAIKYYLKRHVLRHSLRKVQVNKCSQCEYETTNKSDLALHTRWHKHINEIDLLKCPACEYQTFNKSHLRAHGLCHKNPTEIEMHKCSQCDYQTKRKPDLKRHFRLHKHGQEDILA